MNKIKITSWWRVQSALKGDEKKQNQVEEFKADQKEREFYQRISKVTFTDEECYVTGPDGRKRYSMRQHYNNLLRNRDNASRKKVNTQSQRNVDKIYKNKWVLRAADDFGAWINTSQQPCFNERDLYAKHDKVWTSRLTNSGNNKKIPASLRDGFGEPGKFSNESAVIEQQVRDAQLKEKRVPIDTELNSLKSHLQGVFGDLTQPDVLLLLLLEQIFEKQLQTFVDVGR